MNARRRDEAKVGTLARRVVARKRGPSGDAPRTRSLEEWCGQGRTRPHSMTCARVAVRPLRPKLAPAGSGRTAEARMRPATRSGPVPRSHPRKRGPCSTLHRPATMQAPHLTQPNKFSSLSRDLGALGRRLCGSSLCRPARRRPRPLARPRRAEQVPSALSDGCDPGAGCSAGPDRVLFRAFTVASQRARRRAEQGSLWDVTP